MSCLAPCPACNRHIAIDETACRFCSAALPDSFRHEHACRRQAPGHLSRAALMAAGAALLGAASCLSTSAAYGTMYVGPGTGGAPGTMNGGADGGADDGADK